MIIILLEHRHKIWCVLTLIGGRCYQLSDWVMFVSLRHRVRVSSYSLFNIKWYISIVEISFLLICTCVSFSGKSICRWMFLSVLNISWMIMKWDLYQNYFIIIPIKKVLYAVRWKYFIILDKRKYLRLVLWEVKSLCFILI